MDTQPATTPVTVLAAEDDKFQAEVLRLFFQKHKISGVVVPHGRAVLDYLADPHHVIEVIVLDMNMPVLSGMDTLKRLHESAPHIPVIFLTGVNDMSRATEAMRQGAFDYIVKPLDPARFALTIRNAQHVSRLQSVHARTKWRTLSEIGLHDLIGHADGLSDLVTTARKIAATDVPVLIGGETGTGKEVFAHAIHNDSPRSGSAFVAINCAAIPENLVESILFGHEKGAFTGATDKTPGKFREAEGGTIFLDEIGDMPLSAQTRLLRVLQQHEIQPVGAAHPVPIHVRVIAATNKNLEASVSHGTFREDLFYRLNVLPLTLPPLRQRPRDILPLARHFIERFFAEDGLPARNLSKDAEEKLLSHTWPGNVRELENTIRRAMVLASSELIYAHDLQIGDRAPLVSPPRSPVPQIQSSTPVSVPAPVSAQVSIPMSSVRSTPETVSSQSLPLITDQGTLVPIDVLERQIIQHAFQFCNGNIQAVSRALGIARATVYRKLEI